MCGISYNIVDSKHVSIFNILLQNHYPLILIPKCYFLLIFQVGLQKRKMFRSSESDVAVDLAIVLFSGGWLVGMMNADWFHDRYEQVVHHLESQGKCHLVESKLIDEEYANGASLIFKIQKS